MSIYTKFQGQKRYLGKSCVSGRNWHFRDTWILQVKTISEDNVRVRRRKSERQRQRRMRHGGGMQCLLHLKPLGSTAFLP